MNETGAAIETPIFCRDLKHLFAAVSLKHFIAVAAKVCFKSHPLVAFLTKLDVDKLGVLIV
jgi:hypothetical protein